MESGKRKWIDLLRFLLIQGAAVLVSLGLARVNDDNNPFAMAVFLLAVALTARLTDGYVWGLAASLCGTFCVNYIFTYPFWEFDITYPGYPLTFAVMLIVSLLISALTTQIKQQEALKREIEHEKMHADLLRAVAHDIRTPLAAVLGASTALQEQDLPPEDRKMLIQSISREASWLVRMTENLLSVTRFTGSGVSLRKSEEVLEEIIGSAVHKYRQTDGSLPVCTELPEDVVLVPADGTLLEQVFLNLFDNVSAHAAGATRIRLRVEKLPDRVRVCVEDDGCGMTEQQYRLVQQGLDASEKSRPDGSRGMGIGLSVCRSVILAHGGTLTARPGADGGTAFEFELPLEENDDDPDSKPDPDH